MTIAEAIYDIQSERRDSKRHQSRDGLFLVENAANREPLGELLDISANGLAFVYSADVEALQESGQLNVVSVSREVSLEKISYQNINDFDYIRNYPFDAYPMRRRGVSFTALTEEQAISLEAFIKAIYPEKM